MIYWCWCVVVDQPCVGVCACVA